MTSWAYRQEVNKKNCCFEVPNLLQLGFSWVDNFWLRLRGVALLSEVLGVCKHVRVLLRNHKFSTKIGLKCCKLYFELSAYI